MEGWVPPARMTQWISEEILVARVHRGALCARGLSLLERQRWTLGGHTLGDSDSPPKMEDVFVLGAHR